MVDLKPTYIASKKSASFFVVVAAGNHGIKLSLNSADNVVCRQTGAGLSQT